MVLSCAFNNPDLEIGLIQVWDPLTGKLRANLLALGDGKGIAVSADGQYVPTPKNLKREIVYIIQTSKGREPLTPRILKNASAGPTTPPPCS